MNIWKIRINIYFQLRNNREFTLEAIKQNGFALQCVSSALQKEREIVKIGQNQLNIAMCDQKKMNTIY